MAIRDILVHVDSSRSTPGRIRAATGLAPEDDPGRWDAWRAAELTELVRAIRARLREERPAAALSAAVSPTPETAAHHHQDYVRWLGRSIQDPSSGVRSTCARPE